jgi:hypothetical protein
MADAHSPSNSRQSRAQRAQQGTVMRGYGEALRAAYTAEPLPPHITRLLDQLGETERAK